jgi:hypothetical protein
VEARGDASLAASFFAGSALVCGAGLNHLLEAVREGVEMAGGDGGVEVRFGAEEHAKPVNRRDFPASAQSH